MANGAASGAVTIGFHRVQQETNKKSILELPELKCPQVLQLVLYGIALHCIVLHRIALYCILLCCMYLFIYVQMYGCMGMCHVYLCVCWYVFACVCVLIRGCAHMRVCVRVSLCVCVCLFVSACVRARVFMCAPV